MINGKVLSFGYGDISVGASPWAREIMFKQFKPPVRCGDHLNRKDISWVGKKVVFEVDMNDYQRLKGLLSQVKSKEISNFVFKNYVFDFTNYNEKSVEVCRQKLSEAMSLYLLAMAC